MASLAEEIANVERCARCGGRVAAWWRLDCEGNLYCSWYCARQGADMPIEAPHQQSEERP
jgi:hypothetical protein